VLDPLGPVVRVLFQASDSVMHVAHVALSPLVKASQALWQAPGSMPAQAMTALGSQATLHLSE